MTGKRKMTYAVLELASVLAAVVLYAFGEYRLAFLVLFFACLVFQDENHYYGRGGGA